MSRSGWTVVPTSSAARGIAWAAARGPTRGTRRPPDEVAVHVGRRAQDVEVRGGDVGRRAGLAGRMGFHGIVQPRRGSRAQWPSARRRSRTLMVSRREISGVAAMGLLIASAAAIQGAAPTVSSMSGLRAAVRDEVLLVGGGAAAAGVAIAAMALPRPRRRGRDEWRRWTPRRRGGGRALFVAFCALALVAVPIVRGLRGGASSATLSAPAISHASPPAGQRAVRPGSPPTPWLLTGAIVTLAVGGLVLALPRRHVTRAAPPRPPDGPVGPSTWGGWPADPRAAVLAAYERGESDLIASGHARHRDEGPREFCTRIASERDVDDVAARTLTALYEHARYSRHPISSTMRTAAIDAHGRLRRPC
jgi:hypothetical protein